MTRGVHSVSGDHGPISGFSSGSFPGPWGAQRFLLLGKTLRKRRQGPFKLCPGLFSPHCSADPLSSRINRFWMLLLFTLEATCLCLHGSHTLMHATNTQKRTTCLNSSACWEVLRYMAPVYCPSPSQAGSHGVSVGPPGDFQGTTSDK